MMASEAGDATPGETPAPTQGRLTTLWVLMVVALALHNLEEWLLDMADWMSEHPWLPGRSLHGDPTQFALALMIVTVVILLIAVVAVVFQPDWSAEVLTCLSYALMINAASHLGLSVLSASLMPGAITGVLILIPLGLFTVRSLPRVRWKVSTVAMTVIAAAGVVFGSLWLAGLLTTVM